jgi:hypothetical protein
LAKEISPFSRRFHDVTSGNNSAAEFDAKSTPVSVAGFVAGTGWDADTGAGSPIDDGLVNSLIRFVSPDNGGEAIEKLTPHRHGDPSSSPRAQDDVLIRIAGLEAAGPAGWCCASPA